MTTKRPNVERINRRHGVVSARVLPGWVVAGSHATKGDVSGRVAMVGLEGGVLLELETGRLAGFNAEEARQLRVIREVDVPYDIGDHGDLWLTGWRHAIGAPALDGER